MEEQQSIDVVCACPDHGREDEDWSIEFTCVCAGHDHEEEECIASECLACGMKKCPQGEPLHFHHDGCPVCRGDSVY